VYQKPKNKKNRHCCIHRNIGPNTQFIGFMSSGPYNFGGFGDTLQPSLTFLGLETIPFIDSSPTKDVAQIQWSNFPNLSQRGVWLGGDIGLFGILPDIFLTYPNCFVIIPTVCTTSHALSDHCGTRICDLVTASLYDPLSQAPDTMTTEQCRALPRRDFIVNALSGGIFNASSFPGSAAYCDNHEFYTNNLELSILCANQPVSYIAGYINQPNVYINYEGPYLNTSSQNIVSLHMWADTGFNVTAVRWDCLDFLFSLVIEGQSGPDFLHVANLGEQLQLLPRLYELVLYDVETSGALYSFDNRTDLDFVSIYDNEVQQIFLPIVNYIHRATAYLYLGSQFSMDWTNVGVDLHPSLVSLTIFSSMTANVTTPVDIATIDWSNFPALETILFYGNIGLFGIVPDFFGQIAGSCLINVPLLCTSSEAVFNKCNVPHCSLVFTATLDPLASNPTMPIEQCRSLPKRDYIINQLTASEMVYAGSERYCDTNQLFGPDMVVVIHCADVSILTAASISGLSGLESYYDSNTFNTSVKNVITIQLTVISTVSLQAVRFDCLDFLVDLEIVNEGPPMEIVGFAEQVQLLPRLRHLVLVDVLVSPQIPLLPHLNQEFILEDSLNQNFLPIAAYIQNATQSLVLSSALAMNWTGVGDVPHPTLNILAIDSSGQGNYTVRDINSIDWANSFPSLQQFGLSGNSGLVGQVPEFFASMSFCQIDAVSVCTMFSSVSSKCNVVVCSLNDLALSDPLYINQTMPTDECRQLPTRAYILNELAGGDFYATASALYCDQSSFSITNCNLAVRCAFTPVSRLNYQYDVNTTGYTELYIDTPQMNVFDIDLNVSGSFTGRAVRFDCMDYLFRLSIRGNGADPAKIDDLYEQITLLPRLSILILVDIGTNDLNFWSNLTQTLVVNYNSELDQDAVFFPLIDYIQPQTIHLSLFSKDVPFNFTGFGQTPTQLHYLQLGVGVSVPAVGFLDINTIDWQTNFPELFTPMSVVWFEGNLGLSGIVPSVFANVWNCIITSPDLCTYDDNVTAHCGTQHCPQTLHDAALIDPLYLEPNMTTEQCRQLNTRAYILDQLTGGLVAVPGSGQICEQNYWDTSYGENQEYLTVICANKPISALSANYYVYVPNTYYSDYLPTPPNNIISISLYLNNGMSAAAVRFDCMDYLMFLSISNNNGAINIATITDFSTQVTLLPRLQTLMLRNIYVDPEFMGNFTSTMIQKLDFYSSYTSSQVIGPVATFLGPLISTFSLASVSPFDFTGFGTQNYTDLRYISLTTPSTDPGTSPTDVSTIDWTSFPLFFGSSGVVHFQGAVGLFGDLPAIFANVAVCNINVPQLCTSVPEVASNCGVSYGC